MTEPSDDALVCAYLMGAEDYKDKIKELQAQNRNLKEAVAEIWWMARRYADGRSTYAPHQFNSVTQWLRSCSLLTDTDNGELWASDGDLGRWDPETEKFEGEK